jgi:hypothetical protein
MNQDAKTAKIELERMGLQGTDGGPISEIG